MTLFMPNVSPYSALFLDKCMKIPRSSFTNKSWKVVVVGLSHTDKENDQPMTLASNFTNILLDYHHIAERQADVLKKTTQLVASRQKVIHRGGRWSHTKKTIEESD